MDNNLKFEELLPVLGENYIDNTCSAQPIINTDTTTLSQQVHNPTKAPGRFPYPLDTIMDEFADSYLKLYNAKKKLEMASNSAVLPKEQRKKLKTLRDKIAITIEYVQEVAMDIELNFTLEN